MHGLQSVAICKTNVPVSIIKTVRPEQKSFCRRHAEITFLGTQLYSGSNFIKVLGGTTHNVNLGSSVNSLAAGRWHHDDVIKWKHFPRSWPFVRGIHRSPVDSPHKGQWRGALIFSLMCVWTNGWAHNRDAGDYIITGPIETKFTGACMQHQVSMSQLNQPTHDDTEAPLECATIPEIYQGALGFPW